MRYLDCPKDSFAWKLRQLLADGSAAIDPAVGQFWHELIGDSPPCLSKEIQRAAFAILWMGLRGEREGLPSMLATSFAEAAGVAGHSNSYNGRRIAIVLKTLLGWTRRRLRRIFSSNGRRQGQTDVCSSRLATIEMVTGKATFGC